MTLRWTLSRKVLLLALLNLSLLGGLLFAIAHSQFQVGAESVLLGPVHERLLAVAGAFTLEYENSPSADARDALVAAYAKRYGVEVFLTTPRSAHLAGPAVELPKQVRDEMRKLLPPPPRREDAPARDGAAAPVAQATPTRSNEAPAGPPEPRPDPPRKKGPPRKSGPPPDGHEGMFGPPLEGPPRDQGPPEGGPPPRVRPDPPAVRQPAPPPPQTEPQASDEDPLVTDPQRMVRDLPRESVFLVITRDPTLYWAGIRVLLHPTSGANSLRPAVLLLRSSSLFTNRIFFEWRWWLGVAAGVIVISVVCWLPFLRGLTRSIAGMDRVTKEIAQGNFATQAAYSRRDELGDLGSQINLLSGRLEGFVKNQKRFLGDIAHELSAPIARIQFALGILERKAEEPLLPHVAVLHDEVQEMSGLVNELLQFSKAGLQPHAAPLSTVDIAAVVQRAAARESSDKAEFQIAVPEGLAATANEHALVRAVSNILRNAVRYAGQCGPIAVTARQEGGEVVIAIADSGPGLPEGELEEVFAPFYRPEISRTRETGGAGLGLAIVKTCVEACRGTVIARNREDKGLEVLIRLSSAPGQPGPQSS